MLLVFLVLILIILLIFLSSSSSSSSSAGVSEHAAGRAQSLDVCVGEHLFQAGARCDTKRC
eukprot:3315293-Pyramimonas_sp.AAC.1